MWKLQPQAKKLYCVTFTQTAVDFKRFESSLVIFRCSCIFEKLSKTLLFLIIPGGGGFITVLPRPLKFHCQNADIFKESKYCRVDPSTFFRSHYTQTMMGVAVSGNKGCAQLLVGRCSHSLTPFPLILLQRTKKALSHSCF